MAQEKTPGVYIREENAFPNSVVEVATAVPAFIGYTERALRGSTSLNNVPTRLSSLTEFERLFGGPPATQYVMARDEDDRYAFTAVAETRFLLYYGMRMFFNNGGGTCWVVSVGGYGSAENPVTKAAGDFEKVWVPLEKEQEPTMIVVPDAVLLPPAEYKKVSNAALMHCTKTRSRVAILDVYDGYKARTNDDEDVISGVTGFRNSIQSDLPSYALTYYPWVNTNIVESTAVNYTNLDTASRAVLHDEVLAGLSSDNAARSPVLDLVGQLKAESADNATVTRTHQSLVTISEAYRDAMRDVQQALNVMPPSAAMAGVITRTDNNVGVFKAPANTGVLSVLSPTVNISHDDQEDLNVPLDGKAINAIRTFMGRGVMVWGARTLDGNSQDWRYINVRRTLIMLEQSIYYAAQAYVFAINDAGTWQTVKSMIENFLNNQWKAGALAGTKPADAYDVSIGLGSTMTGNDILDGYMRVTVRVAVVRPAEFIVITFQQKMQTS